MRPETELDGALEGARALAVDETHRPVPGEDGVVEELLDGGAGLVRRQAEELELVGDVVADGHRHRGGARRRRPLGGRLELIAGDSDRQPASLDRDHVAVLPDDPAAQPEPPELDVSRGGGRDRCRVGVGSRQLGLGRAQPVVRILGAPPGGLLAPEPIELRPDPAPRLGEDGAGLGVRVATGPGRVTLGGQSGSSLRRGAREPGR